MARTKQYWYDIMVGEKNTFANLTALQPNVDSSQTLLNDATSQSDMAAWRLLFWCIACCAQALDSVNDLFKATLDALAKKAKVGQTPWYQVVARAFQYGDTPVWNGEEWAYPVIDATKQIVERVSAKDIPNKVRICVAKVVAGVNTPLSNAEKDAFVTYMQKVRVAGTELDIVSAPPDDVRLYVTVNYDPLVLSSTGESLATPGVFPAVDAANAYLKTLNDDKEFKGLLELMTLIDNIEAATGVVSAYVTDAQARYGGFAFVSFPQRYEANAGYVQVDVANPLNSTFTYTASV